MRDVTSRIKVVEQELVAVGWSDIRRRLTINNLRIRIHEFLY